MIKESRMIMCVCVCVTVYFKKIIIMCLLCYEASEVVNWNLQHCPSPECHQCILSIWTDMQNLWGIFHIALDFFDVHFVERIFLKEIWKTTKTKIFFLVFLAADTTNASLCVQDLPIGWLSINVNDVSGHFVHNYLFSFLARFKSNFHFKCGGV